MAVLLRGKKVASVNCFPRLIHPLKLIKVVTWARLRSKKKKYGAKTKEKVLKESK